MFLWKIRRISKYLSGLQNFLRVSAQDQCVEFLSVVIVGEHFLRVAQIVVFGWQTGNDPGHRLERPILKGRMLKSGRCLQDSKNTE